MRNEKSKKVKKKEAQKEAIAKQGKRSIKALNKKGFREMLLESLTGPIEMLTAFTQAESEEDWVDATEWVDAQNLGSAIRQAFVVDLRDVLTDRDPSPVVLPWLGTLIPAEAVTFEPSQVLRDDSNVSPPQLGLLKFFQSWSEYFDMEEIETGALWRGETLSTVFRRRENPYPGQELLASFWALLICAHLAKDPALKSTLANVKPRSQEMQGLLGWVLETTCLFIHDAICCGAGIHIETIGTFELAPKLSFRADDELTQLIALQRGSIRANSSRPEVLFTWIES